MESHGWTMRGPLNTDNIRAQDGTLAASIVDGTGDIIFQRDIEARDIDARRNLSVFNNLEVQGPLSNFIQDISVGQDADITRDLSVGQDGDITRDLAVGRNANVVTNLTVGNRVQTVNLRMTGSGPAVGKILTAVDALGNVTWGSGGYAGIASVPTGEKILFYKNTAIFGYTIVITVDDDVVYITKGTAAGGQAGGAAKPGGTWSHNHTAGSHTHPWSFSGNTGIVDSWSPRDEGGGSNTCANKGHNHFLNISGNTAAAAGNTGNNTTWRPKGQNFTLQQRN